MNKISARFEAAIPVDFRDRLVSANDQQFPHIVAGKKEFNGGEVAEEVCLAKTSYTRKIMTRRKARFGFFR
jgi:hypothetical protein